MRDRYKKVAAVFIPIYLVLGILLVYVGFFNYGLDVESKPVKILENQLEHKVVIKNTSLHDIKNVTFSYPKSDGSVATEQIDLLKANSSLEKTFKTTKDQASFEVYVYAPNHLAVKRKIDVFLTSKT